MGRPGGLLLLLMPEAVPLRYAPPSRNATPSNEAAVNNPALNMPGLLLLAAAGVSRAASCCTTMSKGLWLGDSVLSGWCVSAWHIHIITVLHIEAARRLAVSKAYVAPAHRQQ